VGIQSIEHLELSVEDVDSTVSFYKDVIGLVEIARTGEAVYLGCGLDGNWDVAFREGPTGVGGVAFRAEDLAEIELAEGALNQAGITTTRSDGAHPNQAEAVQWSLDSGLAVEYVLVSDNRYHLLADPAIPSRRGFQPLDLDHIAIQAPDVKATSKLFVDVLKWRETEHLELDPASDMWHGSFLRKGLLHHDVAVTLGGARMHHWALAMSSIDHVKMAIDVLAAAGTDLELGVSRHRAGGNIFAYFIMPDGHRLELSCEMSIVDHDTPPRSWSDRAGFDAWGSLYPTAEFLIGT
jgi:catechol 2,3-dioxygenase